MTGATRFVGRYAAGSEVLGTHRIRSLPLEAAGQSLSVAVLARPYLWLRGVLAEGATGRAYGRAGEWLSHSAFRAGGWTRLVGAALVGAGCGRVIQGAVLAPALLAAAGLLMVVWGPWLLRALGHIPLFVTSTSDEPSSQPVDSGGLVDRRDRWVFGAAVAICAASGVAAGLAGSLGPAWLVAGALVVTIAVALLWRPEAILLVAAFFPWMDVLARQVLGGMGAAWDEALLVASLLLILWGALVTGRLRLRTVPATLPALCMLTAAVGSIVVRGVPSDVGQFALRLVVEPLLFYFVGFLLLTTGRWLRAVVGAFLASTTALSLHALYQYIAKVPTPASWLDSSETGIVTRAYSIMGKPNELGAVLAIGILISVALALAPRMRRSARITLVAVAVVQLGAVAVTYSRSAWLGVAIGLVALLTLAYRKYLLPAFGLAALGLLVTPRVFIDRFLLVFSDSYLYKAAVDGRTYRWTAAVDHIAAHPWFGNGLGTVGGSAAQTYDYWAIWVDNYYLQMGAEGGLLLLAAFVWLLLTVAKGLVKSFKVSDDPFARALAAGVFGALVAVCVSSMFLGAFETRGIAAGIWLMAGVATSAGLAKPTGSRS